MSKDRPKHPELRVIRDDIELADPEADTPSITCPRCGRTSHHPDDVDAGYCGNCHDWTGVPT